MVFNKPTDIIVILSIFSLCAVTVGFAVSDINTRMAAYGEVNNSYFTRVSASINGSAGFQGMAADSIDALSPANASSGERTDQSILKQGFTGLVNLGQSWALLWDEMQEATGILRIPGIYAIIIGGLLGISFFIVVYTWIRARSG